MVGFRYKIPKKREHFQMRSIMRNYVETQNRCITVENILRVRCVCSFLAPLTLQQQINFRDHVSSGFSELNSYMLTSIALDTPLWVGKGISCKKTCSCSFFTVVFVQVDVVECVYRLGSFGLFIYLFICYLFTLSNFAAFSWNYLLRINSYSISSVLPAIFCRY